MPEKCMSGFFSFAVQNAPDLAALAAGEKQMDCRLCSPAARVAVSSIHLLRCAVLYDAGPASSSLQRSRSKGNSVQTHIRPLVIDRPQAGHGPLLFSGSRDYRCGETGGVRGFQTPAVMVMKLPTKQLRFQSRGECSSGVSYVPGFKREAGLRSGRSKAQKKVQKRRC